MLGVSDTFIYRLEGVNELVPELEPEQKKTVVLAITDALWVIEENNTEVLQIIRKN